MRRPADHRRLDREWTYGRHVGLDADAGAPLSKRAVTRTSPRPLQDCPHQRSPGRMTRQGSRSPSCATPGVTPHLDARRRVVEACRAATGADARGRTGRRERMRRRERGDSCGRAELVRRATCSELGIVVYTCRSARILNCSYIFGASRRLGTCTIRRRSTREGGCGRKQ
jgi:hypothetical protein